MPHMHYRRKQLPFRRLGHENLEVRRALAADAALIDQPNTPAETQHQNPADRFDVDESGSVTLHDALTVISDMRHNGIRQLTANDSPGFVDVNGDGFVNISDPFEIVAVLRQDLRAEAEAAREAASATNNAMLKSNIEDALSDESAFLTVPSEVDLFMAELTHKKTDVAEDDLGDEPASFEDLLDATTEDLIADDLNTI